MPSIDFMGNLVVPVDPGLPLQSSNMLLDHGARGFAFGRICTLGLGPQLLTERKEQLQFVGSIRDRFVSEIVDMLGPRGSRPAGGRLGI